MNTSGLNPFHDESPEFLPTRWSLIQRLKDWQDQDTWKEFFQIYSKLIYQTAMRGGCSSTEAEEVVQETIITVARKIAELRTDAQYGSFKGWLLQVTRRRTIDQLRKRHPRDSASAFHGTPEDPFARDSSLEEDASGACEPDSDWDRAWDTALLEAALEKVKLQVNPKHYQVFQLHVLQEQPIREVARALDVSCAQVYLIKHRLTRLVEKELKSLAKRFS